MNKITQKKINIKLKWRRRRRRRKRGRKVHVHKRSMFTINTNTHPCVLCCGVCVCFGFSLTFSEFKNKFKTLRNERERAKQPKIKLDACVLFLKSYAVCPASVFCGVHSISCVDWILVIVEYFSFFFVQFSSILYVWMCVVCSFFFICLVNLLIAHSLHNLIRKGCHFLCFLLLSETVLRFH